MDNTSRKCPKCGKRMSPNIGNLPKRKDALQCKDCRRKQQDEASHKIKKEKRKKESLSKSYKKADKTGAKKHIEDGLVSALECCLEDRKNPTKEEFEFLADQIMYDFEVEDLPKKIRDETLKRLSETKFKSIFDKINSTSSESSPKSLDP